VDLLKLSAPLGKLTLSFDVTDGAGDVAKSPAGVRTVTFAAPPAAPTKVTATVASTDSSYVCPDTITCYWPIRLSWHDNAVNESGYVVYATPLGENSSCGFVPDGPRRIMARLPANSTSWHTQIGQAQPWFNLLGLRYSVAATNASGSSQISPANDLVMFANCNMVP
jgi:hypothetical protein